MKIDIRGLREHFREGIAEKTPLSRDACPSPSDIASLFDPKLRPRKRARLMKHIVGCGPCAEEFDSWLALHREEEALVQDICAWAARRKETDRTTQIQDGRSGYSPPLGRARKMTSRPLVRKYGFAAGAAILAAALIVGAWLLLKPSRPAEYRASAPPALKLVQPKPGGNLNGAAPIFSWVAVPKVDYYVLEIFDESLAPVWKSTETEHARLILPQKALQELRPGRTYYWLVTAVLRNAKWVESETGSFRLKEP
jgi:hypothetical protein